ncbi:unnamed protein product [Chrysoparadoxa australica]
MQLGSVSRAVGRRLCSSSAGEGVTAGVFRSPITASLWEMRTKELKMSHDGMREAEAEALELKAAEDSRTSVTFNFSQDSYLRESYRNPWSFIRTGRILEDLDALAGTIAFKHCSSSSAAPPVLVTASVDSISISRQPSLESDMTLSGEVVWCGSSSLQINMKCVAGEETEPWLESNFTFVARSRETQKATPVNPLKITTRAQYDSFREVQEAKDAKKLARHLRSIPTDASEAEAKEAAHLLDLGLSLSQLPCLKREAVPMRHTKQYSLVTCMPQQRNTANRIFGGYLMHRAFSLAHATAYLLGGSRPSVYEVDEVTFHQPVHVGDLVQFESSVLFTTTRESGVPSCHVEVLASVLRPEALTAQISNRFNIEFEFPDLGQDSPLVSVLPSNLSEANRVVRAMRSGASP